MMKSENMSPVPAPAEGGVWKNWQGLRGWNYYFLVKFALLWGGYLNFHPLANLVFAAAVLFPLPTGWLRTLRNVVAIPVGLGLFYHDTLLPGLDSIVTLRSQATDMSLSYMLEFLQRFINWSWIGAAFALWVGYLFASQWLRFTPFIVAALVWLNVITLDGPAVSLLPTASTTQTSTPTNGAASGTAQSSNGLDMSGPPTEQNLSAYYDAFVQQQKGLSTAFPTALPADAVPFDLLIINICSLSWSDMQASGLTDHPLWKKMNLVFDDFNSATSYSGPAAIQPG